MRALFIIFLVINLHYVRLEQNILLNFCQILESRVALRAILVMVVYVPFSLLSQSTLALCVDQAPTVSGLVGYPATMFGGSPSFDVEQPFQSVPIVNNPASTWLHTPPMHMPWGLPTSDQPSVMRFTGETSNTAVPAIAPITPIPPVSSLAPVPDLKIGHLQSPPKPQSKRKSWDCEIEYTCPPTKQLITEEKMAENLNCLHISNSYVSHQIGSNQPMSIQLPKSASSPPAEIAELSSSESSSSSIVETSLDGKDRTVSLCEQLRKLISESSVIPSPLLNKVERPTNALVLWQPPGESIFKNIVKTSPSDDLESQKQQLEDEAKAGSSGMGFSTRSSSQTSWSDLMDNNNSNSAMDLNLLSPGSSSSYQLLPSEVPLPDDDAMDLPDDSSMDY